MDETPHTLTTQTLQTLTDRLDALEAENRSLRAVVDEHADTAPSALSRRRLVLGGGAAALGAVVGSVTASPVAAGGLAADPVLKNENNVVTAPTSITGDIRVVTKAGDISDVFTTALAASNQNPTVGTALYGVAQSFGVAGLASNGDGTGVFGRSEAGNVGVHGFTYGDAVASPVSQFTSGVWGQISSSYPTAPAFLADGRITLRTLANPGGVPTSAGAEAGDLTIRREADGTATWWVCVEQASGGVDARFVRIAGPNAGGAFEPLPAPLRVYDSRVGEPPATGPKEALPVSTERTIDATLNTGGAVPADALVLWINLTATQGTHPGFLSAYSADVAWSGTSNVNYTAGQSIANAVTVRCDHGRIKVRAGGPAGTVHFIVDVIGFSR